MRRFEKPEEIKVGVIGYGGAFNMGREHLRGMSAAGMTPVAVCETDPERLAVAAQDYPGIQTYPSLEKMLAGSDVDLVTIITPHNSHAPLALECLRSGRGVVCEKPLAITTEEVDAMIAAASASGAMLSTYHNRHWDGCILEAVDRVIDKREIGDVVRIHCHMGGYGNPGDWWRTSRTISGGILYDWGVHLLEYSLQLIRSEIREVSGFAHRGFWAPQTKWKEDTNDDEGFAVVRFQSGQWIALTISQIDANTSEDWLEITGTEGTYCFNGSGWKTVRVEEGVKRVSTGKNRASDQERYYQNIADHLVRGEPLVITAEWSRRPIHILDLAVRSAAEGRALPTVYP